MSSALQQFHFLQPWWLLALCVLPLAWWLGRRHDAASVALSRLVDPELLPHLLRGERAGHALPLWLFLAAWTLGALALAGPTWSRQAQPLYADGAAQVVAISLSQHMLARDVAPSRLDRARFKARDLLTANRDGLNALIAYAGEAFVVAPLTSDANSLQELLAALTPDTMPVDGNDAASAIRRAMTLVRDGEADGASLVLITDQTDATATSAAAQARAAGLRVSVLGVGTAHGGPVPQADGGLLHDAQGNLVLAPRADRDLAALAAAGGGRYVPMSADHSDIDALRSELRVGTSLKLSGQTGAAWQDRGPWLLVPLLLLVALAFRRGWLFLLALMVLPTVPGVSRANTWNDLWQRPDQQAVTALHQGDARRSQQLAQDPSWRGAAAYRAGDFATAALTLKHVPGAVAAYNRGNALAREERFTEAISAYDEALKLDPQFADAVANRKSVQDWLRQKKPPPQKSGQEPDKKQPSPDASAQKSSGSKPQQQDAQQQNSQQQNAQQQNPQQHGPQSAGSADASGNPSSGANGQAAKPQSSETDRAPSPPSGSDAPGSSSSNAAASPARPGSSADRAQPSPTTPQQQAAERAKAEQAQQALRQQMDEALAGKPSAQPQPAHDLGAAAADDKQSKLPADVRRALHSVPDDPGALLRRKFELEYRQRHGGRPSGGEQP